MANSILHATIIEKNASGDKTIIYPKNTTKDVLDGSQTLEQTLNTLKSNDISNKTTAFTQAATRQNLASGETLATSHGKIMKLISDLKSLAFLDKVGVANLDGTLTTEYNKRITTDKVTTSTSITSAGYVADARAINSLQNQINTLNSNYTTVQNGITELGKSVANGKNLIGGVVGGNSSSTFATLANNAQNIKNERDNYYNQISSKLDFVYVPIGSAGLTISADFRSFPLLFMKPNRSDMDIDSSGTDVLFVPYNDGGRVLFTMRYSNYYIEDYLYNGLSKNNNWTYPTFYLGTQDNSTIRYNISMSNNILTITITPYYSDLYKENFVQILYFK